MAKINWGDPLSVAENLDGMSVANLWKVANHCRSSASLQWRTVGHAADRIITERHDAPVAQAVESAIHLTVEALRERAGARLRATHERLQRGPFRRPAPKTAEKTVEPAEPQVSAELFDREMRTLTTRARRSW